MALYMFFGVNAKGEQVLYVYINKNELNFQKSLFQNSNSYIINYVEYVGRFDLSIASTSDKQQLDSLCELVNLENDIPKNL